MCEFISLLSILLVYICVYVLVLVRYCFNYSSFAIYVEIGKCDTSIFVIFQDCSDYLNSFMVL